MIAGHKEAIKEIKDSKKRLLKNRELVRRACEGMKETRDDNDADDEKDCSVDLNRAVVISLADLEDL